MRAPFEAPGRIRHLAVDERGVGLRATWRMERGFVNLSLWRRDVCVETFHLTPVEASRLIGFLVEGLAQAVPAPGPVAVRAAPAPAAAAAAAVVVVAPDAPVPVPRLRERLADELEAVARRLRS